jgi:excisionase family DNA binding protein
LPIRSRRAPREAEAQWSALDKFVLGLGAIDPLVSEVRREIGQLAEQTTAGRASARELNEDSMSTQPGSATPVIAFPTANERLLPLMQAAARLGISLRTLEDWVYDERITTVKIGRCRRIKESTIDGIIAANTRPAKSSLS